MRIRYKEWDCVTSWEGYAAGGSALVLRHAVEGDVVSVATVNLDVDPPAGCVWIKEYSENEGMVEALVDAGMLFPHPVQTVRQGFVEISAYRVKNWG